MSGQKAETAYVHIGVEKTGTTAIQEYLFKATQNLMGQGYYVANELSPRNNIGLTSLAMPPKMAHNFFLQQGRNPEKQMAAYDGALGRTVQAAREANCSALVFSSEHLSSWVYTVKTVAQLCEILSAVARNVVIIVYLRRQDRLAQSLISEFVKSGGEVRDGQIFDAFDPTNHKLQLRVLVENYVKAFGREAVIVRPFVRSSFPNGDVIEDFLQQIGAQVDKSADQKTVKNEGLTLEGIWTLSKLNTLRRRGLLPKEQFQVCKGQILRQCRGSAKLISADQAREFYQNFDQSNRRLFSIIGKEWEFDGDFSEYPDVVPKCDAAKVDDIFDLFGQESSN